MLILIYFLVSIPIVSFSVYLCKGKRLVLYSNAFFISFMYIQGLLIKPACVALGIPSPELIQEIIDPVSIEHYWHGSIALAPLYLLFLVSTLSIIRPYKARLNTGIERGQSEVFSVSGLSVLLLIALVGAIGFLIQFPQLLTTLQKNSIATADLRDYDSGGIWRLLVSLTSIVSLFSIYNIGRGYRRGASVTLIVASGVIGLSHLVISDQRANIFAFALLWLVAYHVFIRHLKAKVIFAIVVSLMLFGVAQTVYRMTASYEVSAEALQSALGNIIGRNGIEHSKTIHIIDSVPRKIDYMYGRSFVDGLVVLIPRALYPEKTTVGVDSQISRAVFDHYYYGAGAISPGLIAEMFLNFHVVGVLVGIVLIGRVTGLLDRWFDRWKGGLYFQFFYLIALVTFGAGVLGSGVSMAITALVPQGLVLFACFRLCRVRNDNV